MGIFFLMLGVVMFFDSALISIGNALFLFGLVFAIGLSRSITLFTTKLRGTVCFFFGVALVMMRWGLVGILVEGFGFLNLFGNFLPTVLNVARQVPILSKILDLPGISQAADFIVGKTRPKYSV